MAGPHALFRESVLDSGQNESCVSGILVLSSVSPCLYTLEQATSLSLCSLRVWASAPLCMAGAQAWGLGRSSVADLSHLGWDHLRAFLSLWDQRLMALSLTWPMVLSLVVPFTMFVLCLVSAFKWEKGKAFAPFLWACRSDWAFWSPAPTSWVLHLYPAQGPIRLGV